MENNYYFNNKYYYDKLTGYILHVIHTNLTTVLISFEHYDTSIVIEVWQLAEQIKLGHLIQGEISTLRLLYGVKDETRQNPTTHTFFNPCASIK